MLRPDGQTIVSAWRMPCATNVNITNYFRQVAVGAQLFSKDVQTFQFMPSTGENLLLMDINGFGSVTQVTSYAYCTNGPATNYLQEVVYPNGDWRYYTYDSIGRKLKEYAAFQNSPPPTPGTEPDPTNAPCQMTLYSYTLTNSVDGTDDGGDPYNPWAERKMTIYLPDASGNMREVSRAYRWTVTDPNSGPISDEREQCPNPGMPYGDAANIKTATYYTSGTGFADGKASYIVYPDGSYTSFSYPDIFTTVRYDPDGTVTTNVVDTFGNPQSDVRADESTGVVLSQVSYRYTNSMGVLYDSLMRTHDEIDLAGRVTHYVYDCCTLESLFDPDGVQTEYSYDEMKRRVTTTVFHGSGPGIITSNALDAVGNVLAVTRIGTNNTAVVLQQSAYDLLGRVIASTNALTGRMTITNVLIGGQLCVTNVSPDGGTWIDIYNLDGTIQSTSGTAVHGTQFSYDVEQDPNTGYWRRVITKTKLDSNGSTTSEWTKTFKDGCGMYGEPISQVVCMVLVELEDYWKSATQERIAL